MHLLVINLFLFQHSMDVYRKKILRGYLDKDPNYVLPSPPPIDAVIEVKSLKPTISNVELFCHIHPRGRELAVVVKGDHFWFSRAIEIEFDDKSEKIEIAITAENVSQKQIECTHTLDEDSDLYRHCTDELQVVVSVESQFTTSVRRKRITAIFKVCTGLLSLFLLFLEFRPNFFSSKSACQTDTK